MSLNLHLEIIAKILGLLDRGAVLSRKPRKDSREALCRALAL